MIIFYSFLAVFLADFICNIQRALIFPLSSSPRGCAITRFSRSNEASLDERRNIGRCLPSSARSAQRDIRETSFPQFSFLFLREGPAPSTRRSFPSVSLFLARDQAVTIEQERGEE